MPTPRPTAKPLVLLLAAVALFASAPATGQTADLSAEDFAQSATESGLTQLMLSYLALQKAREGPVEDFAWTMIEHHGSSIGGLAQSLGGQQSLLPAGLPMGPSAEQARTIERLRSLDGEAFDEAYFEHQLEAHREAIALYEAGSQVDAEGVAQYAATTLPILQAHLEIAQMKQTEVAEAMRR